MCSFDPLISALVYLLSFLYKDKAPPHSSLKVLAMIRFQGFADGFLGGVKSGRDRGVEGS